MGSSVRKHILIIYYVRLNSFLLVVGELFARLSTLRADRINYMLVLNIPDGKSQMISRLLSSGTKRQFIGGSVKGPAHTLRFGI